MEKPRLTIGCIGHEDHGKTSLLVAMAGRAKAKGMKATFPEDMTIETRQMVKSSEKSLKDFFEEIYKSTKK